MIIQGDNAFVIGQHAWGSGRGGEKGVGTREGEVANQTCKKQIQIVNK